MVKDEKLSKQRMLEWVYNTDISNYDLQNLEDNLQVFYDSMFSSLINKLKNDAGNFDELNSIKQIKKDIYVETRNQYKIIISHCDESKQSSVKIALKKYNFLHFLKFAIRILDADEEYNVKIEECKKYFSDEMCLKLVKYLYNQTELSNKDLLPLIGSNYNFPTRLDDLIIIKEHDDTKTFSLSPRGKNLYAFFMMKNIDIGGIDSNYNEGKVNQILDFLIQYISTQSDKRNMRKEKPILNSSSAKYNLDKLLELLDKQNNYLSGFIQNDLDKEVKSYNWTGGKNNW